MGKRRKIFSSLLDEVVHYSVCQSKSGHYLWFFTSLFVSNSGSLGEFAVSLVLSLSLDFHFSLVAPIFPEAYYGW